MKRSKEKTIGKNALVRNFSVMTLIIITSVLMAALLTVGTSIRDRLYAADLAERMTMLNRDFLKKAAESVDGKVSFVHGMLYAYINDAVVKNASMQAYNERTIERIRDFQALQGRIAWDVSENALIDEILIVIPHANITFTSTGLAPVKYLDNVWKYQGWSAVFDNAPEGFVTRPLVLELRSSDQKRVEVELLSFCFRSDTYEIAVLVEQKHLRDDLHMQTAVGLRKAYIFDPDGKVVVGDENAAEAYIRAQRMSESGVSFSDSVVIDGTRYLFNVFKSPTNRWTYAVSISYDDILASIGGPRWISLIMYVVIILVSVGLGFFYRQIVAIPLRRILGELGDEKERVSGNEFTRAEDAIDAIRAERVEIQHDMETSGELVRQKLIETLLLNGDRIVRAQREKYFAHLEGREMQLLLIQIEDPERLSVKHVATSIMVSLSDYACSSCIAVERPREIVVLLAHNISEKEMRDALEIVILALQKSDGVVRMCMSSRTHTLNELQFAYQQLDLIREARNIRMSDRVCGVGDVITESRLLPRVVAEESRLLHAVTNGDIETTQELISEISFAGRDISYQEAKEIVSVYFDLLAELISRLGEYQSARDLLARVVAHRIVKIPETLAITRLEKLFLGDIAEIAQYYHGRKLCEGDRVIQYIKENYDGFLTLDMVAEYFHMSPSYLSTYIKKRINMTYTDYTHPLKLEMAKAHLAESQDSLSEIASRLGFTNSSNFIRFFRKMTGMTPGEFRRGLGQVS